MEKEYLIKLFSNQLIAIYDDKNDNNKFHVGIIHKIYDESFVIKSFNLCGLEDGLILIRNTDVYKISKDNSYLRRLEVLIKNHDKIIKTKALNNLLNSEAQNGIENVLKECYNNDFVLVIKLIYDDKFIGKISHIDEEFIQLVCYSDYGEVEGVTLIKYEDIESVYFNGIEEKLITYLIANKI